jgi:hypothetical protein
MVLATTQPTLKMLDGFIDKVPKYPISASQLLKYASKIRAPQEVINFYKSFSPSRIFDNKDELSGSSEQVEIMRSEGRQMPKEEELSPEDY